jgi:hypothetical protein
MKKVLLSLPIIFLCACSNDMKSSLGLTKDAPDEFTVISYPPLSVPPEFDLRLDSNLHPLAPVDALKSSSYTYEEALLLKRMSLRLPNSAVKQSLENEHKDQQRKLNDRGLITQTLGSGEKEEPVVDPEKEKERISKNLQEGTPINEGEIETRAEKTTIEKLFKK